jgi:hypothetical protein
MNTLKMMFGGGTDIASLAEKIRQFGRGEDKILAHITPEEAAMLKEQGGSGTINPLTGLPEFQQDYGELLASEGEYGMPQQDVNYREQVLRSEAAMPGQDYYGQMAPGPMDFGQGPMTFGGLGGMQQPSYLPPDAMQEMEIADMQRGAPAPIGGRQVTPEEENIFGRTERGLQELRGTLDRYPTLTRFGGAGASLLGQALLQRRAGREREAEAARLRERAQPFRAAETEALERARGGGLTPMQAREMQRQMGQARQGLSAANRATGSAAAGILAGQEQRSRSVARQESLQSALDLAGIADRYERQAIAEELAKDKELADLFAQVVGREIEAATRTQAPQQAPQRRA